MFGHPSRALYAVWSNPAPGVSPERFREYYEDVHRPDTLAIGHFDRSHRYEAQRACRARYLTLWEAEYPDLERALECVRKGALALREQGRIWPVQEVVFHQFGFAVTSQASARARVETLTTLQNDWRTTANCETADAWARAALPGANELAAYDARYLYAHAGRFLWLAESGAPVSALDGLWRGRTEPGLPPLGAPIPIFPPPSGTPAIEPDPAPPAPHAAWVVHWKWIS